MESSEIDPTTEASGRLDRTERSSHPDRGDIDPAQAAYIEAVEWHRFATGIGYARGYLQTTWSDPAADPLP
ncbi:MAG TPA: hypothetical protein VEZ50_18755 [Nodosilinea sp.]|nr:hypothetical protein [Nodosilinea sp.]